MKQYIPLTEAQGYSDRIEWGELGFPVGFDESQIRINIDLIEKIARWGCLGSVAVHGYRGETSETSPSIVGMDDINTALAGGRKAAKKTPISQNWIEGTDAQYDLLKPYHEYDARIAINTAEIDNRIREDDKRWPKGLMDPGARAYYLNDSLRRGILGAIHKHELSLDNKIMSGIMMLGIPLSFIRRGIGLEPVWSALQVMTTMNITLASGLYLIDRIPPWERKWSFFYGIRFDRLAVVHALARTQRLVKAIESRSGD